ncbi:hypothetical protein PtrSN002B_007188 [Pyrenophora tritici-repentis]|uniref:Uncharacterized protein n=3 Tax=Pyrenophora tritici-repentis TaxID=45151 RepID=A0A922NSJ4_9PLEO|nr:hypothetical protein Alg130_09293 [Pyrenophora tritici-repentis]KAI0606506.1 hypothetical protein TUN205_09244 [Pyrenophora tritici-repentis]KAI1520531.1 hypothetical protein Ptr86124_000899 [Pyrenophora tritici-repentis]KAI1545669.1 hypothetical protein PtrSN002B_007188 [Pyrenophora tritici-repentis]KAI1675106.1 hypothetical protein L13192_01853 [Pyrenophora tritici-repentis]
MLTHLHLSSLTQSILLPRTLSRQTRLQPRNFSLDFTVLQPLLRSATPPSSSIFKQTSIAVAIMVNKWTPELDSILVRCVFEECNVSFSKGLCAKIAERVTAAGMECTPKAIENRLYSWKRKATSSGSGINSSASTPVKKPAAAPATSKAAASRTKGKGKKVNDGDSPEGLVDDEEAMRQARDVTSSAPTSAAAAKKGKAKAVAKPKPKGKRAAKREPEYEDESSSADEEATVHVSKKVKKEEDVFDEDHFPQYEIEDDDGEFDSE